MTDHPLTFERLVAYAAALSPAEKVQLVQAVMATLQDDLVDEEPASDWHTFLQETYGILADDPIQRWPQGDYEERDEIP